MPFVPIADTAQVEIRATLLGVPVENVQYFQKEPPAPFDAAELEDLTEAIADGWLTHVMPELASNYTLREVYARALDSDSAPTATTPVVPPVDGSQTGEALPGQNAIVVTFRTAKTGRSYRGRNYICGITEGQSSGNSMTSGAFADLQAAWAAYEAAVESAGYVQVVASRQHNGIVTGTAETKTSSVFRENKYRTQRGRTE